MTTLIDDYLREVEATLRAEPARKRQIVDELRSHLHEKVAEHQRNYPSLPRHDVERHVLADFGSPRALALAYEPSGDEVLKNQAGEIVLRLGAAMGRGAHFVATDLGPRAAKAVGRGTGTLLKWVAISLAACIVLAVGLGIWAFYEVRPVVETLVDQSTPAYEYRESCLATPCNGQIPLDVFHVGDDVKQVRFGMSLHPPWDEDVPGSGSVRVIVTTPDGHVLYDRTSNVSDDRYRSQEMKWAPSPGNWTVSYEFIDFRGSLNVEAYAMTVKWSDL